MSTKSWHYRMNWEFRRPTPPGNLCPYVRFTLTTLMFLSIVVGVGFSEGFATGQFIQRLATTGMASTTWMALQIPGFFGFCFMIVGVGVLIVIGLSKLVGSTIVDPLKDSVCLKIDDIKDSIHEAYSNREPSLIVEWYKAKHDQLCPQLTFEAPTVEVTTAEVKFHHNPSNGDRFFDFETQVKEDCKKLGIDIDD